MELSLVTTELSSFIFFYVFLKHACQVSVKYTAYASYSYQHYEVEHKRRWIGLK